VVHAVRSGRLDRRDVAVVLVRRTRHGGAQSSLAGPPDRPG
jgi:hypothetical protein